MLKPEFYYLRKEGGFVNIVYQFGEREGQSVPHK